MKRTLLILLTATALTSCQPDSSTSSNGTIIDKVKDIFSQDGLPSKNTYQATSDIQAFEPRTYAGSYLVGRHAQMQSDWQMASKAFNQLLDQSESDDNAGLLRRALVLAIGSGDFETALKIARTDVNQDDAESSSLANLVLSLDALNNKNYEESFAYLNAMPNSGITQIVKPVFKNWLSLNLDLPENEQSVTNNGLNLYHAILRADAEKNVEDLKAYASKTAPLMTLNSFSRTQIGDILYRNGLEDLALEMYRSLLDTEHASGETVEDRSLLGKIENIENDSPIDKTKLYEGIETSKEGVAKAMTDMATLFFQEGGMDSARLFAQMALQLNSSQNEAKLLLAYLAAQTGQTDEAIAYFNGLANEGVDQNEYIRAKRQVAHLYEENDEIRDALNVLKDLVEETGDVDSQIQIGDVYRHQEEYKLALHAYNEAFSMLDDKDDPQNWPLYYSRGMALERLGRYEEAEKDLLQALEWQPNHPYILNYLGYSWADQGIKLDRALEMIAKAVALEPNDGYITDSLGWVYFRMGLYDKALPYLEQAVELLPYDSIINDHLGDLYWQLGRKSEARFQWERALNAAEEDEEKEALSEKLKNGLDTPATIQNPT